MLYNFLTRSHFVECGKLVKDRQAPLHHFAAYAGAQAEEGRAAEVATGHHQKVVLFGPVRKRLRIAAGGLHEQVERAVRIDAPVSVRGQGAIQGEAVFVVVS